MPQRLPSPHPSAAWLRARTRKAALPHAGRRVFLRRAAGLAALLGPAACGGGGGSSDPAASLIVPVFLYAFVGTVLAGDPPLPAEVRLTLTPQNPLTSDGAFVRSTLSISFAVGPDGSWHVTGTFSGDEFSIAVEGAAAPVASAYRGSFTDRDTVRLVPSDGSARPVLVLRRDARLP
jgi:hypothetical protein